MTIRPGFTLPPVGSSGAPIMEHGIFTGIPGARALSCVTPNLADRTTWYQKAVKITSETLTDSGDGLSFNSVNPWWVDIMNTKLTYSYKQIFKRDGTWGKHTDWIHSVSVNGTPVTSGFTVNFATGTITFGSSQAGNTVTATYWTNNGVTQPSEWLLVPPAGHKFTIQCVEIQYSMNIPATMDTIRFEIWAGASLAQYVGNASSGSTVASAGTVISVPAASATATTASFTQPNPGSTVVVSVADTSWMAVGHAIFIYGGGFYGIGAILSSTSVVLQNLGYTSFSQGLYDLGYGQFRADYRNVWDIINVTNNMNSTVIPKHGPLNYDLMIAPFNYTQATLVDSAVGTLLRCCLVNDTPIPSVELTTACFYMQLI